MAVLDRWDAVELDLLRRGEPVPSRTRQACATKRTRLGLKAPRKPRQEIPCRPIVERDIPHPDWWERAEKMSAAGMRQIEIAEFFGKLPASIRYALDPDFRASERVRRVRNWDACEDKAARAEARRGRLVDHERDRARTVARERWRAQGGRLTDHYRHLECL